MNDAGHNYTFGSPSPGWPTFGPDGKVVREAEYELCRSPVSPDKACVKNCGRQCRWAGK